MFAGVRGEGLDAEEVTVSKEEELRAEIARLHAFILRLAGGE